MSYLGNGHNYWSVGRCVDAALLTAISMPCLCARMSLSCTGAYASSGAPESDAGALYASLCSFGPFEADYMFHCHNTVHEDNAMMGAFGTPGIASAER